MENTDKEILRNLLSRRIGQVVNEIISNEQSLDEDVRICVSVDAPSCYIDDTGKLHTGRLIVVDVCFTEDEGDED